MSRPSPSHAHFFIGVPRDDTASRQLTPTHAFLAARFPILPRPPHPIEQLPS